MYVQKHGVVPVLFIDGVDLVAKHNPLLFSSLITQAKIMANVNILSIVFISSERSVMLLLKKASGMNRSTKIVEVNDIPDEAAYDYLVKQGASNLIAKRLVKLFWRQVCVFAQQC